MSSRKVTEGEETYVEKALEEFGGPTRDKPVWMDWVLKKKREKIQDRLLVVSLYRILSIKRNKMGKKTTQRQGHLYTLRKVVVDTDFNRCVLKFPEFHIEFSSPKIQDVIDAIRTSFQKISYEWPESAFFQINAPEGSIKDLEELDVTPAEGLLEVYNSYCNFYASPPSPDFKRFVEDTFQNQTVEFNISLCPGIEPKTEYTFDLRPALSMFAHCRQFRSFKLANVARREAVGVFANPVGTNQAITRIVLSGLDAGPEGFIALGDAFKKNPGNKVCELDLSDNKMGERGIAGLSSGLMTIQHGLTRFNIGKNGITPKGITSLISSLRANSQVSGTLLELDLSENKFEAMGSQAFADWVTDLKDCATIETLNLADTSIDVPVVMGGIRLGLIGSITHLNLSNNRIDKLGAQAIALLLESSPHMQYLNLSYCKLAPEGVEQLLVALKSNNDMQDLKLDFSGNELGASGAEKVANGFNGNEKVHTIILQDNGFKVDGMRKILSALMENSSIKCLDLSSNLKGSTNTKPLTDQLCHFMKKHSTIETLILTGDSKSAYGKDIVDLFNALNDCPSLTELDVSGNRFGDRVATEIAEALRKNTTLTYMAWDNNAVNIGGYQAFRSCLTTSNKTLLEVPHPQQDVEKAVSSSKDPAKFRERITELFSEINAAFKSNKEAKGIPADSPLTTNIFSRQKAEYKEPPETPPVSAAPTTQSARIATLRGGKDSSKLAESGRGSLRNSTPKKQKKEKGKGKGKGKEKEKEKEADDSNDSDDNKNNDSGGDETANPDETETPEEPPHTPKATEERRMVAPPPLGLPPTLYQSDGVNVTVKTAPPPVFSASMNGKPSTLRGSGPVTAPVFNSPSAGRGRGAGGFSGSQSAAVKPPSFVPPATPPPIVDVPTPPPPEVYMDPPAGDDTDEPPPPPPPRDDLEDEELFNYG